MPSPDDFTEGDRYRLPSQRDDEHLTFERIQWRAHGSYWNAVFTDSATGAELKLSNNELSQANLTAI